MRILYIVLLAAATAVAGNPPWLDHYRAGLEMFNAGDRAGARHELEAALAARPEPALGLRIDDVTTIDYMPHLYLAITAWHLGDGDTARAELMASEAAGVAAGNPTGHALLEHYRTLMAGPPPEPAKTDTTHTASGTEAPKLEALRPPSRHAETLPADEVRRLARETLIRCGLPADTQPSMAPWYFHYELGRRLADEGDPQRALDSLLEAADRKPLPDQRARMYGMWYVDYRPYLEIAASNVRLGNWECAFNALELSKATGEIPADAADEPAVRYLDLLEETLGHVDPTTPSP